MIRSVVGGQDSSGRILSICGCVIRGPYQIGPDTLDVATAPDRDQVRQVPPTCAIALVISGAWAGQDVITSGHSAPQT